MQLLLIILILLSIIILSLSLKSTSTSTSITSKLYYKKDNNNNNNNNNLNIDIISKNKNDDVVSFATLLSATSLIAGTTVGAGILALPSVALKPGFLYSSIALIGAWLYMVSTGLLIAEVSCNYNVKNVTGSTNNGILSLTKKILGSKEATLAGTVYIFIHYALLTAYIAEAGEVLNKIFNLPTYIGPLLFTSTIGSVIAFGSSNLVEQTNNFFVLIILISFLGLVSIGLPLIKVSNLLQGDISSVYSTIPVMFVALVYHNVVPSVCETLKYDKKSIQNAITYGSFIPLLMFLIWNFVILGIGANKSSIENFDPVDALRTGSGNSLVSSFISIFSESAIITSFLGFVIGLMSFYTDIFPNKSNRDLGLYTLVLIPPLIIAISNPNIFLGALDLAGTFGISLLFGAIPCLLAWKLRGSSSNVNPTKKGENITYQNFVPFGNSALLVILAFTGFVIYQKVFT
jgi:tyrosine-specific transport protein